MIYIENQVALFRGDAVIWPSTGWGPRSGCQHYAGDVPNPVERTREFGAPQAEALLAERRRWEA